MSVPTGTASLNKSVYAPGEQMTLTVTYADADSRPVNVVVDITDAGGNITHITATGAIVDPSAILVSDAERTWTKVSDTGAVAVYRSVA